MAVDASRNVHVTSILLAAIVLGVALNVAQFRSINARAPKNYRALVRYANADLVHIGTREAPLFRARHGRALEFAKVYRFQRVGADKAGADICTPAVGAKVNVCFHVLMDPEPGGVRQGRACREYGAERGQIPGIFGL